MAVEATAAERIIKALPDCLTRNALWDISCYLGAELQDQEALDKFWATIADDA